ncbi:MAG TPA: type II secretion system F family protein [Candidatus Sumerlaeota bacterium]|nr:type II secretion system F family protein [Candidatus Sumerlaeota bacterium]
MTTDKKPLGVEEMLELNEILLGLVRARVPLDAGLAQAANELRQPATRAALEEVGQSLRQGCKLSEALRKREGAFSETYLALIAAGENAGSLTEVLERLLEHDRQRLNFLTALRNAATYPLLVLVLGLFLASLIFILVIPKMVAIYTEMGAELPWLTRQMIGLSNRWPELLAVLFCGALIVTCLGWSKRGRADRDWGILAAVPFLTRIQNCMNCSTLFFTVGLLLRHQVPLTSALHFAAISLTSAEARKQVAEARQRIENGCASPLRELGDLSFLTPVGRAALNSSAENADFGSVLLEVATYYDGKSLSLQSLVARLAEPALIFCVGFLVGLVVIGLYLPLFNISKVVGR